MTANMTEVYPRLFGYFNLVAGALREVVICGERSRRGDVFQPLATPLRRLLKRDLLLDGVLVFGAERVRVRLRQADRSRFNVGQILQVRVTVGAMQF